MAEMVTPEQWRRAEKRIQARELATRTLILRHRAEHEQLLQAFTQALLGKGEQS